MPATPSARGVLFETRTITKGPGGCQGPSTAASRAWRPRRAPAIASRGRRGVRSFAEHHIDHMAQVIRVGYAERSLFGEGHERLEVIGELGKQGDARFGTQRVSALEGMQGQLGRFGRYALAKARREVRIVLQRIELSGQGAFEVCLLYTPPSPRDS